jgi:hypothetical protein
MNIQMPLFSIRTTTINVRSAEKTGVGNVIPATRGAHGMANKPAMLVVTSLLKGILRNGTFASDRFPLRCILLVQSMNQQYRGYCRRYRLQSKAVAGFCITYGHPVYKKEEICSSLKASSFRILHQK